MIHYLIAGNVRMTEAKNSKDINEKVPVTPVTGWNLGIGLKQLETICNTTPKDTPTYPLNTACPLSCGADLSPKTLYFVMELKVNYARR